MTAETKVFRCGFDWGANTSVIMASYNGKQINLTADIIPTVVGYPKPDMAPGILPRGNQPLFGEEAIRYKLHLDLYGPVELGYVRNQGAARDFARHVRIVVDPEGEGDLWVVIAAPANTTKEMEREMREAITGAFSRFLIVPEPFLAAMGYRDEGKLGEAKYLDPVKHSLFVDIGAGATELCKLQGHYPSEDDLISLPKAGNDVDQALSAAIREKYPDVNISPVTITRIKEENSFVGEEVKSVVVNHPVKGKMTKLDLTLPIKQSCELLVDEVIKHIFSLMERCDSNVGEILRQNILFTGGGSQIRGIVKYAQQKLKEQGFEVQVRVVDDYKRLAAKGALKIALQAKDEEWQIPSG